RSRTDFMATKTARQIDHHLHALLVLFRRAVRQWIADCHQPFVRSTISELDPAHLERGPVHQADEIIDHFEAALAAVPCRSLDPAILAVDADRRQEILATPNAQSKTSSHAVSLSALCALCRHLAAGWPIP